MRRRLRREAARRADAASERMSTPYPGTPKSIPPEISLVDVSAGHDEALAEAMVAVPPSGRGSVGALAVPLPLLSTVGALLLFAGGVRPAQPIGSHRPLQQ